MKDIFTGLRILVSGFFFQCFKDAAPLSPRVHVPQETSAVIRISVSLYPMLFSLVAFKIILFISGYESFDYDVPGVVFFLFLVLGVH